MACENAEVETMEVAVIDALHILGSEEAPAASGVLRAFVVHEDPRITLVPGFLSDSEAQHLLSLAEGHWAQSAVGTGTSAVSDKEMKNVKSSTRTSSSCMLRSAQTEVVRVIEERTAQLAGLDVDYLERLNLVRYQPGELFNEHHDGGFRPKTVFIYLNDLPDGDEGETFFPKLGLQFVPRKGCAIMWSNTLDTGEMDMRMIHAGLPPKTAVKYGVNCFFNKAATKQWEVIDGDVQMDDDDTMPTVGDTQRWHTVDPVALAEQAGREDGDTAPLRSSLRVLVIALNPRLSVVPRFLSLEEVDIMVRIANQTLAAGPAEKVMLAGVRRRLCTVAGLPETQLEALSFRTCTEDILPDGLLRARDLGQTYEERFGKTTAFIFLTDIGEHEAGELRFPKRGLQIRPRAGCAVLWSNVNDSGVDSVLNAHQARPPAAGASCGVQCIFRDKPIPNGTR